MDDHWGRELVNRRTAQQEFESRGRSHQGVPSCPSVPEAHLVAVFLNGLALGAGARGRLTLKLGVLLLLRLGHVLVRHVLEDGLALDHLELGLEVLGIGMAGGVATAARVGHVVAKVLGFGPWMAPFDRELALHS
jgi:hypothetical protein